MGEQSVVFPWYKWLTARPSQDGHTPAPERSWHCCKVPGNCAHRWHNSKITLCMKDASLLPWCHAEITLQFKWQLNKPCRNCTKLLVKPEVTQILVSITTLWSKAARVLVVSTVYGAHHPGLYYVTNISYLLVESKIKFCAHYGNGYIATCIQISWLCMYAGSLPIGCL